MVGGARDSTMNQFSVTGYPTQSPASRDANTGAHAPDSVATSAKLRQRPRIRPGPWRSNSLVERQAATVFAEHEHSSGNQLRADVCRRPCLPRPSSDAGSLGKNVVGPSAIWHSSSMASSRSRARRRPHGCPLSATRTVPQD